MKVTIDISMYPIKDEYIKPIDGFIKIINKFSDLKVMTYPTSTVIQGEYEYTMNALKETISKANNDYAMTTDQKLKSNYQNWEWDRLTEKVDEAHIKILKEFRVEEIWKALQKRGRNIGLPLSVVTKTIMIRNVRT